MKGTAESIKRERERHLPQLLTSISAAAHCLFVQCVSAVSSGLANRALRELWLQRQQKAQPVSQTLTPRLVIRRLLLLQLLKNPKYSQTATQQKQHRNPFHPRLCNTADFEEILAAAVAAIPGYKTHSELGRRFIHCCWCSC